MIITKSISRFARNTLDCLNFVRQLKELGIGVMFEKENIYTLDSKGEVLLSILSSLAQDESRSISENSTWGIRRRFEQGKAQINHVKFLGYDKNKNGELIINEKQAKTVRRIFREFLDGKSAPQIARDLSRERVPKWDGTFKWYENSIRKMLTNEKYKGDALLQKTYTVDFLNKKRAENTGQLPQYYVEDNHPAIIDKVMWEAAQMEMDRRRNFALDHGIQRLEYANDRHPFGGRVICGKCGRAYGRRVWNSTNERLRRIVWQCGTKYAVKGEVGCRNKHVDDHVLYQAFINVFNMMLDNKNYFVEKWRERLKSKNVLHQYKARQFIEIINKADPLKNFDLYLYFAFVEKMTVFTEKRLVVTLLDGTDVECEFE